MRIAILILITIIFLISCSNQTTITCQEGFRLEGKTCVSATTCGDGLCEPGEEHSFCPYDCEKECIGTCNSQVQVYCEPNCPEQKQFLEPYARMQEKVVSCLEDYVNAKVPRVNYKVVHDVTLSSCEDPRGCCCAEGGMTSVGEIRHTNFNGFIPYESKYPTTEGQLLPDEHETTHYILYHLIRSHPSWFSEGIAIQTNERVQCDKEVLQGASDDIINTVLAGDRYLRERPVDLQSLGGVQMSDGTALNENFYDRLQRRIAKLDSHEQQNNHIIGTLWIIGLKVDYDCESECIQKIIAELHRMCTQRSCTQTTTQDIKIATDKVVKKDTKSLFDLLEIR